MKNEETNRTKSEVILINLCVEVAEFQRRNERREEKQQRLCHDMIYEVIQKTTALTLIDSDAKLLILIKEENIMINILLTLIK